MLPLRVTLTRKHSSWVIEIIKKTMKGMYAVAAKERNADVVESKARADPFDLAARPSARVSTPSRKEGKNEFRT